MYPYQNYNYQASYDQEWKDLQQGNFDQESYKQASDPRILDME